MKIILLQDVKGIGRKGDVKDVANGYALNNLIPRRVAMEATPDAVKRHEEKRKQEEIQKEIENSLIKETLESINEKELVLREKANEQGHLFRKVSSEEITEAVKKELKITIKSEWLLFQPIKTTGEYKINVKAGNNTAKFNLRVETI